MGAASAATRRCGRSASFTPGSRSRATRNPGIVYARVGFVDGMAVSPKTRGGGVSPPPPPPPPSGGLLPRPPGLVPDPRLDELIRLQVGGYCPEGIVAASLCAGAERTRGERDGERSL